MKEDNVLVDNAIDQAFEKLEVSDNAAETQGDIPDKNIEAASEEAEEGEKAANKGADSDESGDSGESEDGESTEEQISDEVADAEISDEASTEQVASGVEAPAFLSAETKALWSKIPADVQKALSQDALRTQQQLSRLANEGTRGKQWEQRVNSNFETKEELDAHRAQLRLQGIQDEVGELHNYRDWNKVLKNDPLTAVRSLIVQFGITKEELNGESFSEESEAAANHPSINDAIEQVKAEWKAEREQERAERERQNIHAEINAWKSGNDKYGKPRADFTVNYAPQIDAEFQRLVGEAGQLGIQKSLIEFTDEAFNNVQARIYKQFGYNPQKPVQTPEQREANLSKVKAAAQVASGAPRSDTITKRPKKEYKNEKEWVNDVVDQAIARSAGSRR